VAVVDDLSGGDSVDPGSGGDEPTVVGWRFAQARVAEARHQPSGHGPSPLVAVRYPDRAYRLWRWVPAAEDDAVLAVVNAAWSGGPAEWAELRASLTMDDLYTVMAFARRRALLAVRTGDPRYVEHGLNALALVEPQRVDRRDLHATVALVCFAGQRLEVRLGELVGRTQYRPPENMQVNGSLPRWRKRAVSLLPITGGANGEHMIVYAVPVVCVSVSFDRQAGRSG
jgi:hypothetical protein